MLASSCFSSEVSPRRFNLISSLFISFLMFFTSAN
nr:MAG TPA: hypothetical protein [Caudoviricetes sp.]